VVPFSIALINQASCVADLKQFFSQYSWMFFYCCIPMNTSLPVPACIHHPFLAWGISRCRLYFYFFKFLFVKHVIEEQEMMREIESSSAHGIN